MKNSDNYTITTLEGVSAVRKLPELYLGDISNGYALMKMYLEILDNSVDEYLNGFCNKIIVSLHKDGSLSIQDNGRGIPVAEIDTKDGKMSSLEVALTQLHAGGKFSKKEDANNGYRYTSGVHGVGAACTNFCSKRFVVEVKRDGKKYRLVFEEGQKVGELEVTSIKTKETGTLIRFVPDRNIIKNIVEYDPKIIEKGLMELSFLCRNLELEFVNEKSKQRKIYSGDNNITDFIKHLAPSRLADNPIFFNDEINDVFVDVAIQWMVGSELEISRFYTNNVYNPDGGSHMSGFKSALTRTINNYINSADLPKTLKISLSGDDIREGLISVVSIRHPDPKFSSQTKEKLVSEDARTVVENAVSSYMMGYLEQNPIVAKKIVTQCVNARKAREAAKKAREAIRKSVLKEGGGVLPGKLADCSSRDPEKCELFVVEGDSAGGSAKQGRNRGFQAILPLRGKVLNVERCEFQKMMKNEELTNLITAIGVGIGKGLDLSSIRYKKVIIMTDSDVDGAHIRTLLLTFFFRQMPQLIHNENIYIAQPPLYRVDWRKNKYYIKDDNALQAFVKEKNIPSGQLKLQRFKGLGEMSPDQLWSTTMDPNTRSLLKVMIKDYVEADKLFNLLMGNQVEPRRQFISERALKVNVLDA
jgi:DNA gyrase subunit B